MERLIQLDNLNRQEALRYLGSGGQTPDDAFMALMKDCEKTVLAQARPPMRAKTPASRLAALLPTIPSSLRKKLS